MLSFLVLLAATALPDPPPPPPDDPLPAPVSSGDRRQGPFSRDTYPSELSARPLTLPAGMFRAGGALNARYIRLTTTTWQLDLGLSGGFGLTDRVELGAFATFGLWPLLSTQRVGASGTFLLIDGPWLDLAIQVGVDAVPSTLLLAPALSLALPGRALLNDRLFLTFGAEFLRVQLWPFIPEAALKLGLGLQATSGVAVTAETDLLKIIGQSLGARRPVLPLNLATNVAVARGLDLRVRAEVLNLLNPRLAGVLTLAGSAYF